MHLNDAQPSDRDDDLTVAADVAARKRRLAEVFGDVLPEQTSDDVDPDDRAAGGSDAWLRAQVPPHHGG